MFDLKTQYKLFAEVLGVRLAGPWQDPKIAAWLIDPGASEANLHRLVHNCVPLETHLLEGDAELFLYGPFFEMPPLGGMSSGGSRISGLFFWKLFPFFG